MDPIALIPSCGLSPALKERRLACHCCVAGTAQEDPRVTERTPPHTPCLGSQKSLGSGGRGWGWGLRGEGRKDILK